MNEQGSPGSQASNNPQQSDSYTPDPGNSVPYRPDSRADASPRPLEQRPQKFTVAGMKLRKKNAHGIAQFIVYFVSARYDESRHSWMYTLDDWQHERISGETEENMLV